MVTVYNVTHTYIYDIYISTFNHSGLSLESAISDICSTIRCNGIQKRPISIQLTKQILIENNENNENDDIESHKKYELIAHFFSENNMSYKVLCKINPAYIELFNANQKFKEMISDTKYHTYYVGMLNESRYDSFEVPSTKHLKINTDLQKNYNNSADWVVDTTTKMVGQPKFKIDDKVVVTKKTWLSERNGKQVYTTGIVYSDKVWLKYNSFTEKYEWVYKLTYENSENLEFIFESDMTSGHSEVLKRDMRFLSRNKIWENPNV